MNRMRERITKIRMTDQGCMLRAYSRAIVKAIVSTREVSTYIPALAYTFAAQSDRGHGRPCRARRWRVEISAVPADPAELRFGDRVFAGRRCRCFRWRGSRYRWRRRHSWSIWPSAG
jgi:hypothetical protein